MKELEKDLNKAVKTKFRYWSNFSAFLGYRGNFAKQSIMRKLKNINDILNELDVEIELKEKK